VLPKLSGGVSLVDRVAEVISEEITSGRLSPGDRLPSEVQLVEQLGVSRTVVREAVSRLRNAGLVEPRQGAGVFVLAPRMKPLDLSAEAQQTKASVLQVVEVRRAMEGEAAALAATRATPEDIRRIRAALEAIDDDVRAGGDGVDADLAFHQSVVDSTGNPVLAETLRYIGSLMRSGMRVTRANEARRADFTAHVRREHDLMLEAIEGGDAEAARAAARQHMEHAAERLQQADDRFWTESGVLAFEGNS
jgi:GntR family transcriptional regulator, transcriptional repressor for pyruvate dehydrogenase complex